MNLEDRLHLAGIAVLGSTITYMVASELTTGDFNKAASAIGIISGAVLYHIGSRIIVNKIRDSANNEQIFENCSDANNAACPDNHSGYSNKDMAYRVNAVLSKRNIHINFDPKALKYTPWYKLSYSVEFTDDSDVGTIKYFKRKVSIGTQNCSNGATLDMNVLANRLLKQKIRIDHGPFRESIYAGIISTMYYFGYKNHNSALLMMPIFAGMAFVAAYHVIESKIFKKKYLYN